MSKKGVHDAIARQWELLKLLPARGAGKSAKELADNLTDAGFVISKRTVERDLNDLSRLFPIECNDKGMPYGWRWMANTTLDLPSLTVAEALSLQLLESAMRPLLPATMLQTLEAQFTLATAKLTAMRKTNRQSRWTELVRNVPAHQDLLPPRIDAEALEVVQEALLDQQQVIAEYRSMDTEEVAILTLHPLVLIQRGPVTYLAALAFKYTDVRLYAMHRLSKATRSDEKARRPKDFSVDSYIASGAMQFSEGKTVKLEASISPELARLLSESPLSDDMTIQKKDAGFTVKATVLDSWQLRWWILSQSDGIVVTKPTALRAEIHTQLKRAVTSYA